LFQNAGRFALLARAAPGDEEDVEMDCPTDLDACVFSGEKKVKSVNSYDPFDTPFPLAA